MFAAVFALLFLIGAPWWLAAILGGLISAALSVLLLDRFRSQAATGIQQWRARDRTDDDIVEDDSIDADPTLLKGFAEEDEPAEVTEVTEAPESHADSSPDRDQI